MGRVGVGVGVGVERDGRGHLGELTQHAVEGVDGRRVQVALERFGLGLGLGSGFGLGLRLELGFGFGLGLGLGLGVWKVVG